MIKAGMNVARINFSHGTHESNGKVIDTLQELRKEFGVSLGIMADLQGPRIRTVVEKDVEIKNGEYILVSDISVDLNFQFSIFNFTQSQPKADPPMAEISNDQISNKRIFLDSPGIISDIEIGENILIEDGLKKLNVVEKGEGFVIARVLNGGTVKNHKGVNVPDSKIKIPAVTEKDMEDLEFALKKDVDFVALSFVSTAGEIKETREKIKKMLGRENDLPGIVAKIERKEAIKNIDEIIAETDVIMVARGDLGIEMDESKVVIYQKEIIGKCLRAARPVIVATQMLESMIENPLPTRAEVSDVSNAVIDHTDAVMLSGESANGKFPLKAVETMAKIISDVEESRFDDYVPAHIEIEDHLSSDYASIVASAMKLAKTSEARAVLAITQSGFTARMISNFRPSFQIIVAACGQKIYHQLSMVWGSEAYLFDKVGDLDGYLDLLIEQAKKDGRLESGDKIVEVLGRMPGGEKMRLVGIKEIAQHET